jgi:cytoplasmic iron level regulating protein YaaA (DUF328/UPF0246 family)
MITVISPAKTLDFETPARTKTFSQPDHLKASKQLIAALKKQSAEDLSSLMNISPALATLNRDRYKSWKPPFTPENAKQAVLAFKGDVYLGLEAEQYTARDLKFAQDHLRILSGLYGILRPLDLIQPYRLEMGTRLATRRGKNLYEFWGDEITRTINAELATMKKPVVVNLASNEYFKSVQPEALKGEVITPNFKYWKKDKWMFLSFFAKKARGTMASYIIKNRLKNPEHIKAFDLDGYTYNEELSKGNNWIFSRVQE